MKHWFKILVEKVKNSYSPLIVIQDWDQLGSDKLLRQELEQDYAVTVFQGELMLRQFVRRNKSQQIVVLLQEEGVSLPYDIESNADVISWKLSDVFPRLDPRALKRYPSEDFQEIYEVYRVEEASLARLKEEQALLVLREWVREGRVNAREKLYSRTVFPYSNARSGISESNQENKCLQLMEQIERLSSAEEINWREIAKIYGRLEELYPTEVVDLERYTVFESNLERLFNQFIFKDYEQLFFASYMNGPVTLNQTMNYLSTLNSKKTALLCFDGMGFPEWFGLKEYLKAHKIWNIREEATFALIPTVTGVSRTALFSGKIGTNKIVSETTAFREAVHQLFPEGGSLKKGLFRNTNGKWQRDYLNFDILGIVYSIIDSVAHGMTLLSKSKKTMHNNLIELYPESQIAESITRLLAEGYRVFITADHGSIWCWGNGISTDKYLVEDRARRALVYPNPRLAEEFAERHEVILLHRQGIFEDKVLVFPRGREMFHTRDKLEISHGGIHIEEVIIPFVEVFP